MNSYFITEIWEKNKGMKSLDQALNLYHLLRQIVLLNIPGDVVELGCYRGLTAVMLQKSLESFKCKKQLHLFDSFEGLPPKQKADTVTSSEKMRPCDYHDNHRVKQGWFKASQEEVLQHFHEYALHPPQIHPGWFHDTLPTQLPQAISFAHLDADFYTSTLEGLEHVYPRLSKGGIIVIDDYCDPALHPRQSSLPGVKVACDLFFKDKPEEVSLLATSPHHYQGGLIKLV